MMLIRSSALILLICGAWARAEEACVLARTQCGLVCGAPKNSSNGTPFVSYMGIRYAAPPVGTRRFVPPQPPTCHTGILDATTPGPVCPQRASVFVGSFMRPTSMSEDCLCINVHAPRDSLPNPDDPEPVCSVLRPIIFYLHGGSFTEGSGDPDICGPEYLVSFGVIVVTVNYRLNSFGFLNMDLPEAPGNAGLRDILMALKWVRDNIRHFCGDPNMVTCGGISAGGVLAELATLTPKGQTLCHKLLTMSGTALSNLYSTDRSKSTTVKNNFLNALNISLLSSNANKIQKLQAATVEQILDANAYVYENNIASGTSFTPTIETPLQGIPTLIPKHPEKLIKDGLGKHIPSLNGFTCAECNVYRPVIEQAELGLQLLPFLTVPEDCRRTSNPLLVPVQTLMMSNEYFNNSVATTDKFIPVCTDSFYKYPVMRTIALRRALVGSAPSHIYQFCYEMEGVNPLKQALGFDWTGVVHSEDSAFVLRLNSFYPPVSNEFSQTDNNSKMRVFMASRVANFAKFGHPGVTLQEWPAAGTNNGFMNVVAPNPQFTPATPYMVDKNEFYDQLYRTGRLDFF